ncbi:GxxExxY protein [Lutispora saccharofermentans]
MEDKHFAQLLNYLKTTRKKLGFIINFGASKIQIKRIIN